MLQPHDIIQCLVDRLGDVQTRYTGIKRSRFALGAIVYHEAEASLWMQRVISGNHHSR